MKVNIYTSTVAQFSDREMLSKLRNREKGYEYIIITPDRSNFNIENQIFDILGEDSLFDVNVMTLTRLTYRLLKNHEIESKKILSMQGACSIVQKILTEDKDSLLAFGKAHLYSGFSKELFETISAFKSCRISPDEIVTDVKNVALSNKLHDIKLVYQKYEEFLQGEYTDSFNRLNLLSSVVGKECSNTHFYFVGFDDFTPQQYGVIASLIRFSASVNISTAKSDNSNKHIYLNNIYYNILDICSNMGIVPNITNTPYIASESKQFLSKYVFSFNGKGDLNNYLKVYSFDNMDDEIYHTIASIYLQVVDGARYEDFAILLPSYDVYEDKIKKILDEFNVPYFIDKSKKLCELSSFDFIVKLLNLATNFSREDLIALLKNRYLGLDLDTVYQYERRVVGNGIYGKDLFVSSDSKLASVLHVIEGVQGLDDCDINTHVSRLIDVLTHLCFESNLQSVINEFSDDVIECRMLAQTNRKLSKILTELTDILGGYVCDGNMFVSLFESYVQNTTVAMPPITSCVFVGEQSQSYVVDKKHLYMLGVVEGSVPALNADLGIISDDDIEKLNKKLSPTVAYVNKKRRYKVFENLFIPSEDLTVSFVTKSASGENLYPSSFLVGLMNMGNVEGINGSKECDYLNPNISNIDKHNVIFNNCDRHRCVSNYVQMLKVLTGIDNQNINTLAGTLKSVCDDKGYLSNLTFVNTKPVVASSGLYFRHQKSSISQVQTYCECPYKHFATYGLRLKEVETDEVRPLDFGNIIHRFLEISVKKVLKCDDVEALALDSINKVLQEDKYIQITKNKKNISVIKSLKRECVRILKVVKYQIDNGEFTPKYCELDFSGDKGIKINVAGKTITFCGVIDRVDTYQNYFRIIDYKTGNSEFKDFGDVQSGVRLQLIMYLKAFRDNSHMIPAGAFYLPISSSYVSKDKDSVEGMYRFRGVVVDELRQIFAMDKNLMNPSVSSNIIGVKTNKDGGLTKYLANLRLSASDFDRLADYVYDMLKRAVVQILGGNIQPLPYKSSTKTACNYCPYVAMCNFKEQYGNVYNQKNNVTELKDLFDE